jgi:hypothetical protein
VTREGGFVAAETPNAPGSGGTGEPVKRFATLEAQEIRELQRMVTPAFLAAVGSFPCPPDPDASVVLEIVDATGRRSQSIGGCVHGGAKASPPGSLVHLLERYRFATRNPPPSPVRPPTGEGDPCTTSVGCGKGLVCMPAPCVVAPCVSGACHKTP